MGYEERDRNNTRRTQKKQLILHNCKGAHTSSMNHYS